MQEAASRVSALCDGEAEGNTCGAMSMRCMLTHGTSLLCITLLVYAAGDQPRVSLCDGEAEGNTCGAMHMCSMLTVSNSHHAARYAGGSKPLVSAV
jgi:hypothetical protein